MSHEPTPREMGYYARLAQVGMEMVLPIALGAYLDQRFGTGPWLASSLAVVGFVVGLTHLVLILKDQERDESSDKKPPT